MLSSLMPFQSQYINEDVVKKVMIVMETTANIFCPILIKNINKIAILSSFWSTFVNETIRCASKWFIPAQSKIQSSSISTVLHTHYPYLCCKNNFE